MKWGRFFKRWWVLILIVVVIAAVVIFHLAGFRIGPGVSIVRVGTLVLEDLPAGASIYVDEAYNRRTALGEARIALLPGSHSVIVSLDGNYPWNEIVEIAPDAETHEHPMFVREKPEVRKLAGKEVTGAATLIRSIKLPTVATPLSLENNCAKVYVSGNRIVAEEGQDCEAPSFLVCAEESCGPVVIFAPVETINSVLPYPNRDDMLVISVGQSLFVLELDPRSPQFFAPILKGDKPRVASLPDGSLVVYSGVNTIYEVKP